MSYQKNFRKNFGTTLCKLKLENYFGLGFETNIDPISVFFCHPTKNLTAATTMSEC